mgnify:CR=1 FL=1
MQCQVGRNGRRWKSQRKACPPDPHATPTRACPCFWMCLGRVPARIRFVCTFCCLAVPLNNPQNAVLVSCRARPFATTVSTVRPSFDCELLGIHGGRDTRAPRQARAPAALVARARALGGAHRDPVQRDHDLLPLLDDPLRDAHLRVRARARCQTFRDHGRTARRRSACDAMSVNDKRTLFPRFAS